MINGGARAEAAAANEARWDSGVEPCWGPAKMLTHPVTRRSAGPVTCRPVCPRALGAYGTRAHTERSALDDGTPLFRVNIFISARSRMSTPPPLTGSPSPLDLKGCDNRCPRRLRENEQRVWQMRVWRVSSAAESLLAAAFSINPPCLKRQRVG